MTNPEPIAQAKGDLELKSPAPIISGYGIVKSIRRKNKQGKGFPSFVILRLWACLMAFPSLGQAQVMYGGGIGGIL